MMSSAMPDLTADTVPHLKAQVHRRLSAEQLASIQLGQLGFRPLQASDMEEMMALRGGLRRDQRNPWSEPAKDPPKV
ncbi:unnamed protein product [Effrenium voratum]|uniref:Uncharacterized protein n=1 Tax=Effrenium voratum TaxID=2562239 RepID=A0AA36J0W4_9DINO|nr:unnamed protein product [Effrenium voratum]